MDDRGPVPKRTEGLFGKLVADPFDSAQGGYVSQALFEQLFPRGLHLVTRIKSNVRHKPMPLWDKVLLLRKRSIIETVIATS